MASVIPFDRVTHTALHSVSVPRKAEQLDNIKAHLDLILLALEALTGIGSEAMLQSAQALHLSGLNDRVSLWRLRQASPLRKGQGGRKKLDVEEARTLVLVSCHLAHQHQHTIRQAVALLEQFTQRHRPPHQAPILGDYLDRFCNLYQERMLGESSTPELTALSLKLLIDLLFYSGDGGAKRLWLALMERASDHTSAPAAP